MRYSADWHDDAANAVPEERATIADLRFWINEQNVVRNIQGQHVLDYLTVSAYGLAEGLAHDWWTLFGARDHPVSLMRYRNGFVFPDVRMSYDGAAFEVSAMQREYRNPEVRFWGGASETLGRADAEQRLSQLIEDILARLQARNQDRTGAALRWSRVKESRADPDEAAFCEAAGALRLDPYAIDDANGFLIQDAASQFEGEPLTEFLAGARDFDRRRLVEWVRDVQHRPGDSSRLAEMSAVMSGLASTSPGRPGEAPWALGYRRARGMRSVLGLGDETRFPTYRELAARLGANAAYTLASSADGIRALRSDRDALVHIHLRRHGTKPQAEASHLFSFARAVGDAACFPDSHRAVINDLRQASRQAAGRAFAAEFLAPVNEVLSMHHDGRDVVAISEEFGVAAEVVDRQLENATRIESAAA